MFPRPATPPTLGLPTMRITETDIALAMALADAAGAAIRPHFRAPFDVEIKEDASPVTIADRAADFKKFVHEDVSRRSHAEETVRHQLLA